MNKFSSIQFSSVTQSCPTLCDPTDCSTPGLPVHHQLPEFTQTHVHRMNKKQLQFECEDLQEGMKGTPVHIPDFIQVKKWKADGLQLKKDNFQLEHILFEMQLR